MTNEVRTTRIEANVRLDDAALDMVAGGGARNAFEFGAAGGQIGCAIGFCFGPAGAGVGAAIGGTIGVVSGIFVQDKRGPSHTFA